jgi:hypothetical protein
MTENACFDTIFSHRFKGLRQTDTMIECLNGTWYEHAHMVPIQIGTITDTIKLCCFPLPESARLCQCRQEKSP